jgi:flavin reductase (DIM6/NTAB) family NADH-FMN oxidoreductase RutF
MQIDFTRLPARHAYHWMTAMIVPRPIAWVSSVSPAGVVNLAPFSFFNGITSRPPILMFVPVTKADGTPKDTLRNIEATGEFVVNLVSRKQAEVMNASAAALPPDESEMERYAIEAAGSERVAPPRVAEAPIAMECKLEQITRIGDEPGIANVVFGRILCAHFDDAIINDAGRIDPAKLDLIGRMGGEDYCTTRDQFAVARPE